MLFTNTVTLSSSPFVLYLFLSIFFLPMFKELKKNYISVITFQQIALVSPISEQIFKKYCCMVFLAMHGYASQSALEGLILPLLLKNSAVSL